ncbi:transposase domain-containing protein [Bradyrhizobium macuxiense]|uniref:transposase domain-containing protein n=1 Tax=Bradyrhizobium macuxiense TaxID=1755647 RepID=UPI000B309395
MSDNLPGVPETLKAMLLAERHESERVRHLIKELQRHRFDRKAKSLPEEQMLLGLENVEQVAASGEGRSGRDRP